MTSYRQAYEPKKHKKLGWRKLWASSTHAASQIGDSVAAGALWESSGRERFGGALDLEIDIVARVTELIDPERRELYLKRHAGHTADGTGLADAGAIPKL